MALSLGLTPSPVNESDEADDEDDHVTDAHEDDDGDDDVDHRVLLITILYEPYTENNSIPCY